VKELCGCRGPLVPLMAQLDRFLGQQAALPPCAISPFWTLGRVFRQEIKPPLESFGAHNTYQLRHAIQETVRGTR